MFANSQHTFNTARDVREEMNSAAYDHVLDCMEPQSDDPHYLQCYQFWRGVAGEKHFDPYYCEADYH